MWEKFKPLEVPPKIMHEINTVRHDNNDKVNDIDQWLANGRANDEAFNTSEKAYLEELKKRTSE